MPFRPADIILCTEIVLSFALPASGIVLNEIMYDPDGDEGTDEFVELYNNSTASLNLQGWRISDGEAQDTIVGLEQGLVAAPGQYVLVLDPDYIEEGSTTYDGLIPQTALVVTISGTTFGSRGLSNSRSEPISLIDRQGNTVSHYAYSLGNSSGYSDEKILPNAGDTTSNWADAVQHLGTPGARNSVTPPDRDLGLTRMYSLPSAPQRLDSFMIWSVVQNVGQLALGDTLRLFELIGAVPETTLVRLWPTGVLQTGDSASFSAPLLMSEGTTRRFQARLSGTDDRPENDARGLVVSPQGEVGTVLINEIMYAPEPQRSEWVELVNTAPFAQSLGGWRFGDGTGIADSSRRFHLSDVLLESQGFLVLAADSSIYFENVPSFVPVQVWGSSPVTLNNTGDSLVLYGANGDLADRVDYRPSWGNGTTGFSLERISTSSPSNDPLNWASSVDSTGATPGRVNSRTFPSSAASGEILTLEPNPFSPDGDGRDDLLFVRYRLAYADSRLDVKIYDVRGREVRRLANNSAASYSGEILWDGKDAAGRDLPTGLYLVYLEALGKGGTRIQSAKRAVALARRS
jgi:hypothetical protein